MNYVEVAVNVPLVNPKTFSYSISKSMRLLEGQAVWVPFRTENRKLQGIVFALTSEPQTKETKEIAEVITSCPILSSQQLELAWWISEYFFSPLFDAASLMLPPKFEQKFERKVAPKTVSQIHLAISKDETQDLLNSFEKKRATSQAKLLRLLLETSTISLPEARKHFTSLPRSVVNALERKGAISVKEVRVPRDPLAGRTFEKTTPSSLTPSQKKALKEIREGLENESRSNFLLYGEGRTEIYLQLLAETISLGKRGIVLVPEVALTSQIINHFASRFPGKVAVWHGELSAGEQFDEWQRIKEGEFDIVIGTRSAIFTPLPNLGIVIVDEEQEQTYKQEKKFPRYHARDVALKLAEQMNAVVVLGSATPDVASYYRGQIGEYRLLEISGGISPRVEIVDLRKELKEGNRSIFSRQLRKSIEEVLKRGEQAILFLNRRGSASFVQCRDCGFVARCPNCDIPLTYHSGETRVVREPPLLVCHQCNYRTSVPKRCPECSSKRIKFLGIGTQKVEEEAAKAFPRARLLRWDRDVVRGKRSYEEILRRFSAYEADILIGTQVIAKDVDLSQVALAGVLLADIGLNLPDFRSSERIFQLLTKLTKRARKTIVQTYVPEHYAVVAAAKGDFKSFYRQGIAFRRSLNNPPFSHLTRLLFTHTDAIRCQEEAERVALFLKDEKERSGSDADIIGPSPAYFRKIRDKYRWQIFTRSSDPQSLLCKVPTSPNLTVDADPATVL